MHETRQRNAELALINGVQGAIAGELDPQAIYDLVGDKIRDVFDAQVVSISVYDEASGVLTFPYVIERGERLDRAADLPDRLPQARDGNARAVDDRGDHAASSRNATATRGCSAGSRSSRRCSSLSSSSGRATGVISLQNVDRTHAFGEDDLRLLTTLAGSLSVALDNARLVHETRQRVAELATVNSVGQALSSQLDLDALIELVGEQVRETFERRHRLRRAPRPAVGTDRLRLLLRERAAPGRAVDGVRRRADFPDPRLARAARAQPLAAVRGARAAPDRHPGTVLPGRSDPRSETRQSGSSASRASRRRAVSEKPTRDCWRRSQPMSAWRSRTRACSPRWSASASTWSRSSRSAPRRWSSWTPRSG